MVPKKQALLVLWPQGNDFFSALCNVRGGHETQRRPESRMTPLLKVQDPSRPVKLYLDS